ncbi:hypothetical protein [Microbacterium radiodurans]|uniref:Uncharacterized protein n=1 Tax=Microbacterium radiodurans TaxID=661398 RepID=A0A5J5IPL3_9MICO|nr:hypothetical protein [Microbacterium radiodurans]KAA9086556.1 hypothetical protein F6B42_05925 [Microbacterium radiodurans]
MGEIIDGVPAGLSGDQERTTLSSRRTARRDEPSGQASEQAPTDAAPAAEPDDAEDRTTLSPRRSPMPAPQADAGSVPEDDHTTLSSRHVPGDDRTTLSSRHDPGDDRTTLSSRHVPGDDRTTLSSRHVPGDDHTTLSSRHDPERDDDRTTLSPRRVPPAAPEDPEIDTPEPETPVDDTVFTARPVEPSIVRGRLDTVRAAAVPGTNRERYRPRDETPVAPIRRTHVAPPVATTDPGDRPRRRRRALPVALVAIGSLLVAGGAVTAVTMLVTMSAGGGS